MRADIEEGIEQFLGDDCEVDVTLTGEEYENNDTNIECLLR